jgi:4-hydroxythreonine-4-phosphate dehydrogenase
MRNPLAVSMGDPAGIGPEIIAKAWAKREAHDLPPFVAIGDARAIERVWNGPLVALPASTTAALPSRRAFPC